jgi:hypothetical protein
MLHTEWDAITSRKKRKITKNKWEAGSLPPHKYKKTTHLKRIAMDSVRHMGTLFGHCTPLKFTFIEYEDLIQNDKMYLPISVQAWPIAELNSPNLADTLTPNAPPPPITVGEGFCAYSDDARAGKLCRLVGSMFHFFFKIATSRGGNFDLDLHQDNSPGNK